MRGARSRNQRPTDGEGCGLVWIARTELAVQDHVLSYFVVQCHATVGPTVGLARAPAGIAQLSHAPPFPKSMAGAHVMYWAVMYWAAVLISTSQPVERVLTQPGFQARQVVIRYGYSRTTIPSTTPRRDSHFHVLMTRGHVISRDAPFRRAPSTSTGRHRLDFAYIERKLDGVFILRTVCPLVPVELRPYEPARPGREISSMPLLTRYCAEVQYLILHLCLFALHSILASLDSRAYQCDFLPRGNLAGPISPWPRRAVNRATKAEG